jgi:hypothetical protein
MTRSSEVVTNESEFQRGWDIAREELRNGQIDLVPAFYTFKKDMPDSEWMWGYFASLYDLLENENAHL